jgi:hypothetical protein
MKPDDCMSSCFETGLRGDMLYITDAMSSLTTKADDDMTRCSMPARVDRRMHLHDRPLRPNHRSDTQQFCTGEHAPMVGSRPYSGSLSECQPMWSPPSRYRFSRQESKAAPVSRSRASCSGRCVLREIRCSFKCGQAPARHETEMSTQQENIVIG